MDSTAAPWGCRSCGKGLRRGARYCSFCGSPMIAQAIGLCPTCDVVTLFRRWAGNPWFCTNCGARGEAPGSAGASAAVQEALYCGACAQHTLVLRAGGAAFCAECGAERVAARHLPQRT